MAPAFATCKTGAAQSPIDLHGAIGADLPNLQLAWQPGLPTLTNNGHPIQVNLPAGGMLTVDGEPYQLLQFHFHAHSERTVDRKASPLEIHFVHKNSAGGLAVLGVLVEEGAANPTLEQLFANLPSAAAKPLALAAPNDPSSLLPRDRACFRYDGSLTTPPSSEGVKWHVLKATTTASPAQIAAFTALYPNDARPVQPRGVRALQLDNTP